MDRDTHESLTELTLLMLVLLGILTVKGILKTNKMEETLSEVTQKVEVAYPAQTNNVPGAWKNIKPE